MPRVKSNTPAHVNAMQRNASGRHFFAARTENRANFGRVMKPLASSWSFRPTSKRRGNKHDGRHLQPVSGACSLECVAIAKQKRNDSLACCLPVRSLRAIVHRVQVGSQGCQVTDCRPSNMSMAFIQQPEPTQDWLQETICTEKPL